VISPEEMKTINTTVYCLPCAGFAEKDGSMTNSARWLQWKNVALPPPGEARLDQDIVAQIFLKVREVYKNEGGTHPAPNRSPRSDDFSKKQPPGESAIRSSISPEA
jgi:formate dehydrogenase major subunit